jgi:hypothetical protein
VMMPPRAGGASSGAAGSRVQQGRQHASMVSMGPDKGLEVCPKP